MTSRLRLEATPVLDIGGTHVTAARVANGTVIEQHRGPLDAEADASAIISQIATIASALPCAPCCRAALIGWRSSTTPRPTPSASGTSAVDRNG